MTRDVRDPLQALLQREKSIKGQLLDPRVTEVDTGAFGMSQLGLTFPVMSKDGRMWRQSPDDPCKLLMIFDPNKKAIE